MNRRSFIKLLGAGAMGASFVGDGLSLNRCLADSGRARKPNVLFVAVDDLNDWIEPLGGHPQAKTPNFNRLADKGVVFTSAYCAAPACLPSRSALMSGRAPYESGIYENGQVFRDVLPNAVTIPQYFTANGYFSAGAGKIYHNDQPDPQSWEDYYPSLRRHFPKYIYPTLIELCGLPSKDGVSGNSLVPLLRNPRAKWDNHAITCLEIPGEMAISTERYRYIRYSDGGEELYDLAKDKEEWHNLANDPKYAVIKKSLAGKLPKNPVPYAKTEKSPGYRKKM